MKKEIIDVDKEKGIFRCTTSDERWYLKPSKNKTTGLPEYSFSPSVTWIGSYYHKGQALMKWIANKGWDDAEIAKQAAGDKGSRIHTGIAELLSGRPVSHDFKIMNKTTGKAEELTTEEYAAILSFAAWFKETKPEIISFEYIVWNDEYNYAGTVDLKCKIGNEIWIIDFKSGQNVWPEYEIQLSAYKHADQCDNLGILQVGYKRNKNGYKFTTVEDQFDLFLATRRIWQKETEGQHPMQKDYPLEVSIVV